MAHLSPADQWDRISTALAAAASAAPAGHVLKRIKESTYHAEYLGMDSSLYDDGRFAVEIGRIRPMNDRQRQARTEGVVMSTQITIHVLSRLREDGQVQDTKTAQRRAEAVVQVISGEVSRANLHLRFVEMEHELDPTAEYVHHQIRYDTFSSLALQQ